MLEAQCTGQRQTVQAAYRLRRRGQRHHKLAIGKAVIPAPVYVVEGQGCKEIVAPNTCSDCHAERTGRKFGQWAFQDRFDREVSVESFLVVMDRKCASPSEFGIYEGTFSHE